MTRKVTTDVDIDVFGREKILQGLVHVGGRIERENGKVEKHNTAVYFQNIPRDPTTNVSTVDHKVASNYGYFKIDFLNVNMYEGVKSERHLQDLINREPDWELFQHAEITDQLFHVNGYSHLLTRHKPKSVEDLAMILAIIRPSKAYLQSSSWDKIQKEVWLKTPDSYQFKRSHGIAYALAVVVNLNLFIEKLEAPWQQG